MLGYRSITAICFLILTLEAIYILSSVFSRDRKKRIAFLRNFKLGKCAIVYFATIPLYVIGYLFGGENFFSALFNAIGKVVTLVVLKYDFGSLVPLMEADLFYEITVYYCFFLIAFNALLVTLSLTQQRLWQAAETLRTCLTEKKKVFLFGYNENTLSVYASAKEERCVLCGDFDKAARFRLYVDRVVFFDRSPDRVLAFALRRVKKGEEIAMVINDTDDEKNLALCRAFSAGFADFAGEDIALFERFRIYVFGDPRYASLYADLETASHGCIRYVNRYREIAVSFVDEYPISRFLDESDLDTGTSLIRPGRKLGVCMIGFGGTNRQIFLTSVANNQFLTGEPGHERLCKVRYTIFDRVNAENDKNLNHAYARFRSEMKNASPEEYLPLPEEPAEEVYYHLDVNDPRFYEAVRSAVTGENRRSFVIISYGTDLENVDMARKLLEKRREWNADFILFVKARHFRKQDALISDEGCYFIGHERDIYRLSVIFGDRPEQMARRRNRIYDVEYALTREGAPLSEQRIRNYHVRSDRNWYLTRSALERESNLYCCLSLRSKLHLMGLDYCAADAEEDLRALSYEEYLSRYAGDDRPDTAFYGIEAEGKPVVHYSVDHKDSRRKTLAVLEHYRWNSYMLSKGMVPAKVVDILHERNERGYTNGKNYALRRHGNLTTYEGLVRFRKMIAARDGCSEEEADVIKYDYQILDDAYWLIASCGCKIVEKQPWQRSLKLPEQ